MGTTGYSCYNVNNKRNFAWVFHSIKSNSKRTKKYDSSLFNEEKMVSFGKLLWYKKEKRLWDVGL